MTSALGTNEKLDEAKKPKNKPKTNHQMNEQNLSSNAIRSVFYEN